MAIAFDDGIKQEIWETIRAINDAWTKGNPDDLANYFHENMVAITPAEHERIVGRDACVAGWKGFAQAAKIHSWKEVSPLIERYGDTAVVTYYYEMSCDLGGRTRNLAGRDMLVLVKEQGKWWAVADQFSPYPG
jgi:ketosteroid isomerase-like protein